MLTIIINVMQIRQMTSDFAVMIAIVVMVGIDLYMGVNTPKLNVPSEFRVRCIL